MTERAVGKNIVVGVDGSEASAAALRWAARQAHALGASVVAVHAWQAHGPGLAPYAPAVARPTTAQQRARAVRLLTTTLHEALGPGGDSAVRAVVAEGSPARVLVRQAHGAVLLALGRTPRGAHGEPAAGAVVRDCLQHATVPVVTVPTVRRTVRPAVAVEQLSLPADSPTRQADDSAVSAPEVPPHGARWTCTTADST